jgi:hypothetical protein
MQANVVQLWWSCLDPEPTLNDGQYLAFARSYRVGSADCHFAQDPSAIIDTVRVDEIHKVPGIDKA